MSLKSTKEHLIQLLADQENKVIALAGKWGTGKSHLWREVKDASEDEKVKTSLYVSLFGLSGIDQIKMKLIQNAVPAAEANPGLWESAKQAVNSGVKVLEGFHKSFSALGDLGLMFAPAMLRHKVIVLDDIERKHEKLSIDEILGFIDEFTQQHGSRFVLILNSDQLAKRDVWDTLREKVVDQDIRLSTSSTEAFEIAVGLSPSRYAQPIKAAVDVCGLTNIRVIRKIIKVVNRILNKRENISEAVLSRVIPSAVLLAAINYKAIENGPDFDFVVAQGTPNDWSILVDKEQIESPEGKLKSNWKLLLNELGIRGCDDYELLVIEFLQSGLFDVADVSAIIDRFTAETNAMNAREESRKFMERQLWDHRLSETELLEQAKALMPNAHLLDTYIITSLHEAVSELPGGAPVADGMVAKWIEGFKANNFDDFDDDNPFNRAVHPLIQAEFDTIKAKAQTKTTAFDACVFIAKNSGWGARQEMAMKSATAEEFELIIKSSDIKDLRIFMRKMLEMTIQRQAYESHFGSAIDRFTDACKNIAQNPQSGRLGGLIKCLFADSKLGALLEAPAAVP